MFEDKVTNKLISTETTTMFKAPRAKQSTRTDEDSEVDNNTLTAEEENTTSFEHTVGGSTITGLSKKKKEYLEQAIVDRSGAYEYADDPSNYKKARKRLQNRESAVRSRMKKRQEMEALEEEVRKL